MEDKQVISNTVRGQAMQFVGYTRSLALCSNMNYEVENLDFIDRVGPGEVYYDLGACEGRFSLYAALKGIETYAFEPEKMNYSAFRENLEINGLLEKSHMHAFNKGVGARFQGATIKIGQPWAGGHQKVVDYQETRTDLNFDFKEEQAIEIVPLDGFISQNNLPVPTYLKVDIDGSEMPFLEGASQTLASPKLKAVLFELSTLDPRFHEILRKMEEAGLAEIQRFQVPNEPNLFNILFERK
jgi:FkbM family methyltransferase